MMEASASDKPRMVKLTMEHSPEELKTIFSTSNKGYTSNNLSKPAVHEGTSASGKCCNHICLPANNPPTMVKPNVPRG